MKVCLHIEPYKERTPLSLRHNITYILQKYGNHPAFYKRQHRGKTLPLFYIYDSYLIETVAWKELLQHEGSYTVRGTQEDAIYIGLVVEKKQQQELLDAGFDGMYTYFASDGFSFGSTVNNWRNMADFTKHSSMLFIPSVGPGYNDERVRPWNHKNSKSREGGKYFERSFQMAINTNTEIISVTSFNEWHEGTQIETAIPKEYNEAKYLDYAPQNPDFYLTLSRQWVFKFIQISRKT